MSSKIEKTIDRLVYMWYNIDKKRAPMSVAPFIVG